VSTSIPTTEPASLVIGDRWQWTRELNDYPSGDGWTVKYHLVNADAKVTLTASGSGSIWTIDVAPTTTAAYVAGDYDWHLVASKTGERAVIAVGRIGLLPDFAAAASYDGRSQARKAVDDLKVALATYSATHGQVSEYEIAGRRMRFRAAGDILELLNFWQAEVSREEQAASIAAGLGNPRRLFVRFGA
jgi:hypothetical protein